MEAVTAAERDGYDRRRYFYLDATGKSGKAYLCNSFHIHLDKKNIMTSTSARTGIPAKLFSGKTHHSVSKLPVPLAETRILHITLSKANYLKVVKVFIND